MTSERRHIRHLQQVLTDRIYTDITNLLSDPSRWEEYPDISEQDLLDMRNAFEIKVAVRIKEGH